MHTNDLADMLIDAASELRGIEMHELAAAVDTARARLTLRPAPPDSGVFIPVAESPQMHLSLGGVG